MAKGKNDRHEIIAPGKRRVSQRAAREIADEMEARAGHPVGTRSAAQPETEMPVDMPRNTDMQREQHARKGQAQSPRALTLNQPEKKKRR
jgi:hypothetical protein